MVSIELYRNMWCLFMVQYIITGCPVYIYLKIRKLNTPYGDDKMCVPGLYNNNNGSTVMGVPVVETVFCGEFLRRMHTLHSKARNTLCSIIIIVIVRVSLYIRTEKNIINNNKKIIIQICSIIITIIIKEVE